MKIKNKTELRKVIKNSIGNTGSLRKLWVFEDGTWEIYGQGTSPADNEILLYYGSIVGFDDFYEKNIDKAITRFFLDIE